MSFSAKVAILTFAVLWIMFNFIVFPIVPNIFLNQTSPTESFNALAYITVFYCLIPSIILYILSRVIEYAIAKMSE